MKRMTLIVAAMVEMAGVASQPAAAYTFTTTGRTLASPRPAADVLTDVSRYSKANGGCRFIFSADMRVVPGSFTRVAAIARSGRSTPARRSSGFA
ncbi:MAG TPA: hypothetical protein VNJ10_09855 [Sphingomonas sp.]|nr:hypothetical protein [Sphingomonas sp.]